jgi:predicted dehydrogenase
VDGTRQNGRMRVGFLGAGLIATYHSKMLRAARWIERAGVYDPDGRRAEAFAQASGHHVAPSVEAVLDSCDAVYICTWTSEHRPLVEAALERGLAVFVEKPLATNLADAEAMTAAVLASGLTNQVGLVLRRSPVYLWARHLIDEPAAGRVMAVVFRDDQYIPIQGRYDSTWRSDVARAGAGTLLEHSIHDLDMLVYLCGPVAWVSAQQANFHGISGIEDVVTASLRFTAGAAGTLTSVWHDNLSRPSLRRVEVFCERRWIALTGDDWLGPIEWMDTDGQSGELAGEELAARTFTLVDGSPNADVAFVQAARDRTAAWPDFRTALAAHRLVDAVYRSAARDGSPVDVRAKASCP